MIIFKSSIRMLIKIMVMTGRKKIEDKKQNMKIEVGI